MSRESSKQFNAALVFRRKRSRCAVGIWALQLVVLGAAVLVLASPLYVKGLAWAAWLVIARRTWPRAPRALFCTTERHWVVPARGLERLTLGARTVYTRHWALLELVGRAAVQRELVWADELDHSSWRRLHLLLREPVAPASDGARAPSSEVPLGSLDANSPDR